ncbi:YceI family protein [Tenacibaculum sp. UWU-22]|uniref:YceI family protein n=1 Tax=Tenacibaculum sp. UWU-22 TaxID=3234187 RepID=UPI0034DB4067
MKKVFVLFAVFTISLLVISCKSENKKETKQPEKKALAFSLKNAQNSINWTAYKTTEKIPVKGEFKKVTITAGGEGATIKEAVNGAEFSIPVSSIFTNEASRDSKLKEFFFGIMENTSLLTGKLVLENDATGYADITMNGVTHKLPFAYTISENEFKLEATMKISDWKAEKALQSLNEACKDLHKGADGVSKTWDEVAITISSKF